MNELIQINYEKECPTVSGRELHAFLEVETPYHKWFPRMCEYGFVEGKSYWTFLSDRSDGLPGKHPTDHTIAISMAKEICMLQRSAKGKECREYFIACEESWNSPEKIMERAMQIAHQRAIEAERRIFRLGEEKETLQIELDENKKYYTVKRVAGINKVYWKTLNWKKLIHTSQAMEYEVKKAFDANYGSVNSYHIAVWKYEYPELRYED